MNNMEIVSNEVKLPGWRLSKWQVSSARDLKLNYMTQQSFFTS
jgi:hypothetical protein